MPPIITLLTDFGTADGYVAAVKGVLISRAPRATIVDITHEIPAHDIEAGRISLERYWLWYPPETVHLCVVDPGVGSDRAALAVQSEGRFLVGPDNGLLSPALLVAGARAVTLGVPANVSPTFHARDVFAPVAARLAYGAKLEVLGEPADPLVIMTPEPRRDQKGVFIGEIIAFDRFGNAITNLPVRPTTVEVGGRVLPVALTYADLDPGEAGAVVGSSGTIEIVVREGRAANLLDLKKGTVVRATSRRPRRPSPAWRWTPGAWPRRLR